MAPLVRDYLRLADDLDSIYSSINVDERIGGAIDRFRGLRLIRQDPWECLVSFICSSNSNIPRISTNVEDMSKSLGRAIACGGGEMYAFPSPEALAEAGEAPLRELGLGFRAKYVAAAARIVADGGIDLFTLREAPYEAALEALTALPGVGDKVANCVMLFSLDKLDAFPVDVWVDRVLREWYADRMSANGGKKVTRKQMRPWAQTLLRPLRRVRQPVPVPRQAPAGQEGGPNSLSQVWLRAGQTSVDSQRALDQLQASLNGPETLCYSKSGSGSGAAW